MISYHAILFHRLFHTDYFFMSGCSMPPRLLSLLFFAATLDAHYLMPPLFRRVLLFFVLLSILITITLIILFVFAATPDIDAA